MKNKKAISAPDVTINEVDEPYMEACDPVVLQAMRREGFAPASTPHEGDDDVEAQLNKYLNEMFANQPLTQETMDRIKAEFVKVGLNPDDFTTKFDKQTGELVIKRKVKGPEYINVEFIIDKPNKGERVNVDMKEIERKVNELFRDKEMDEKSIDAALVAEAAETMVDLGFDPDKYDVQFKGKTMRIVPKSWNEDAECDIDDGGKNNREFEQRLRAARLAKESGIKHTDMPKNMEEFDDWLDACDKFNKKCIRVFKDMLQLYEMRSAMTEEELDKIRAAVEEVATSVKSRLA